MFEQPPEEQTESEPDNEEIEDLALGEETADDVQGGRKAGKGQQEYL
jgi:hypothetical protein